ncbi:bifunctional adenosylcobinamide kinase/adenosylcobinamide-phosphate guanylyltransferase [Bacillus sp. FJAT-45037]|uniref:bifunctional adenosylcobinamide kinase/adenosylcobinamide-phosphate guanylyltransferase n=1 Tax=Bacillus sp. FJAT-45037 TaxID=2011007 RepID=UPI000C240C92|nr:bifunctional adenosylcobinamide kinase/adenosylcobinamide-phosphate guanylyltransferase [Bacillus sp. FJAT-45037]
MLIFVTGGVRSGKSSYAESLAMSMQTDQSQKLYYIATSVAADDEMRIRINRHQQIRELSSSNWHVIEKAYDLQELLHQFNDQDVVLIDCLTTLLSNEWFGRVQVEMKKWDNLDYQVSMIVRIKELLKMLAEANWTTVLVSNEVSYEANNDDLIHTYKKRLGELHLHAVECAKRAIFVESGIPMVMKKSE